MVELVERALLDAGSWYEIYARIEKAVPEGQEAAYRSAVWAFGYLLLTPDQIENREREGSPFGAMWEFDGKRLPPRLADVPDEDVGTWLTLFDAIDEPRSRSRIGDLLWERKAPPRPDQKARAAVAALLELAIDGTWEPLESTHGLVRALEVTMSLSDQELQRRAVETMVKAIKVELESEHDRPGIPFSLLRPLVDLPPAARPAGLEALIRQTATKYEGDPHHVETAIDLEARLVGADDVPDVRQRQVQLWREAADKAEGLVRLVFLERALEIARTHGLVEEAKQLRVELGSISEEELDLKKITAETKLDSELVEEYVASFINFDNWQDSLVRFGLQGPPGGEPGQLDSEIAKRMQESPIQFLVTKTVIDPDSGAAIFHAADELTHKKAATAEHRQLAGRLWSVFAVDVLRRIEEKYGRPEHQQLTDFFTAPFIEAAIAERIARAFELWWEGQPDDAAHVLVPRLEAIIRELARQLGVPVIREPQGDKPGGVRSLGDLLFALDGRLPTAGWHAYLINLLSDPLGLNLRNVIGHGMRSSITAEDAALLLHAACFLRLVEPKQQDRT